MALVLLGTVGTFDDDRTVLRAGAVYVGDDGIIDAVQSSRKAPPAGYGNAPRIRTRGHITPGLIDFHNHLAYNFLPLWSAPRDTAYTTRDQWPNAATYGRDVSNPAQAMGIAAAAAALRYAEVKAAAGGATAIQGSPPLTRAFPGWMLRNIEKEMIPGHGKEQLIYQAVIKAEPEKLLAYSKHLAKKRSFIYHLAEGTSPKLIGEYVDVRDNGCAHANFVGIHSTALTDKEFKDWAGGASGPGTIVWSPFSNIWLYGSTTDVLAARRNGILVCLGSDWSPSGTKNLLGELKVASLWNDTQLGGELDAFELGAMATANAGDALKRCWGVDLGRVRAGALADLLINERVDDDPYANLLTVDERHVRLVMVGGRPALGLPSLMTAAGAFNTERIRVGTRVRSLQTQLPDSLVPPDPTLAAEANMTWAAGSTLLHRVVADPAGEVRAAKERAKRRPRGAPRPLQYVPDMPRPGNEAARALTDDELDSLVIPPVQSLAHDEAWFADVAQAKPHAKLLLKLQDRFLPS
jgi:cytosine/adenosine deaminase-related metal-dependent hydrolase